MFFKDYLFVIEPNKIFSFKNDGFIRKIFIMFPVSKYAMNSISECDFFTIIYAIRDGSQNGPRFASRF